MKSSMYSIVLTENLLKKLMLYAEVKLKQKSINSASIASFKTWCIKCAMWAVMGCPAPCPQNYIKR